MEAWLWVANEILRRREGCLEVKSECELTLDGVWRVVRVMI